MVSDHSPCSICGLSSIKMAGMTSDFGSIRGLGRKGANTGLLLLYSAADRAVETVTGAGIMQVMICNQRQPTPTNANQRQPTPTNVILPPTNAVLPPTNAICRRLTPSILPVEGSHR